MLGGGSERQLTYLARALRELGCEVHVALLDGGPNLPALLDTGAHVHRLGLRGNHDVRLLARLVRLIRAVRPDVIQCWLTQMHIAGGIAAVVSRVPWVFAERASAEAYPRTLKNLMRTWLGSVAGGIVSNSVAGDRYWAARAPEGVPRYVIPNGLPIEELAAVPPASLEEAGLAPGEALVLFAGRCVEQKNPTVFVRAMGRVRAPLPLRAMICGDGPLRTEIDSLIRDLALSSTVRAVDYAPGLRGLIRRASVFVSTARFEGHPNVVLEAMAIGCPLVVSDIPEHREFLDERSAILVPPDDPDGFARGIETVLGDAESAAQRAAVAAVHAEAQALRPMAERYLRVYHDLVSRAGGGPGRVRSESS